jgi:streptogramin lyase
LLEDFHGSPLFIRMRADGTIRSEITAKQPDGRVLDVRAGIQAAPDGRLWACDGYSIVRLTDAGIVDRVLGQAPEGRQLGQIAGIAVDRQGHIYAVESRTGSIHVF